MTKSKSTALMKMPKEQRCSFLIGPVSSWFMPNSTDLWTQGLPNNSQASTTESNVSVDALMDDDISPQRNCEENVSLSYFVYGSIGCFCYGEIYHHNRTTLSADEDYATNQRHGEQTAAISTTMNRLIDIKEDNSKVACVRFLKNHRYPLVMILTESGSFLIHDCMSSENLIHFKKSELLAKFVKPFCKTEEPNCEEHNNKRAKFNVTQQINSCVWPDARNAFLAVSLLKEKTNLLLLLKFRDLIVGGTKELNSINKIDFIESCNKLELDLPTYASPVCCMESAMISDEICLVAVAMDDGLIIVAKVNLTDGQLKRTIKLARHNDEICSLSFHTNMKKFPLGLLAAVSRDGLTTIWDINNEFNFADYQASEGGKGGRINWFALEFLPMSNAKHIHLAVSNPDSGINVLEVPENARSKIRLRDAKESNQGSKTTKGNRQVGCEQNIRHHGLIFNITFDEKTNTLSTTSLDSSHIIWSCSITQAGQETARKDKKVLEVINIKPEYLYPTMSTSARTHMLRFNPIREDFVGVALGKAGVKFHKISHNQRYNRFDMTPSCGIIARKINKANLSPTSIAWHPSHEYRVAIGTIEGKVLRADLTPHKAIMIESEQQKKKPTVAGLTPNTDIKMEAVEEEDIFGVEYKPLERSTNSDNNKSERNDNNQQQNKQQPKTDGIYSLCWGPNPTCPEDVSRLSIYAVGSVTKHLNIYYCPKEVGNSGNSADKMINYLDEFRDVSLPEARGQASEVAWKSSMDLMALGTIDGRVIIVSYLEESSADRSLNKLFRKLAVIQGPLGTSHIQCLAWHPTTDSSDARYYYLAASANDSPAYVFSIKESLLVADVKSRLRLETMATTNQQQQQQTGRDVNASDNRTENNNIISAYLHKLNAHKKAISDLVWNPHEPNQLATSSFDRCCYVWSLDRSLELELMEARIMARFQARDRLFTLEWSLVDPDLIFTSGHDSSIWAWRPSENPMREPVTSD